MTAGDKTTRLHPRRPLATEETMVQMPGEATRLRVQVLRQEFDRDEVLRTLLLRYSQILMGEIGVQSGA
jgi:hypothetical protein